VPSYTPRRRDYDAPIVDKASREQGKLPAFDIKARVLVDLDINLALELGDYIIDHKPDNPAIWALGCRLRDLVPLDKEDR
jgi:hypothetical protein